LDTGTGNGKGTGTGFKANTSAGFGTGTGTGFGLVLASVLAKYWLRGLCWLRLKKVLALASASVLALDVV
jgi:hypothetical protein